MPFGLEVDGEDLGVGTYSVIDTAVVNRNESVVIPKFLHPDVSEFHPVFIPQGVRNTMMKEVRPSFIETENYLGLTYGKNDARDLDFDYQILVERDEEYVTRDPSISDFNDLEYMQDLSNLDIDTARALNIPLVDNKVVNDTGILESEYPAFEFYHAHGMCSTPDGKKYIVPLYVSDTEPTNIQNVTSEGYVSGIINWYNPSTGEVKYRNESAASGWSDVIVDFTNVHALDQDGLDQLLCLQVQQDFVYNAIPLGFICIDKNITDYRSSTTFLEEVKNTTGKCIIMYGETDYGNSSLPAISGFASLFLQVPYYMAQYGGKGTITYNPDLYSGGAGICNYIYPYISTQIAPATDIINSLTTLQFNFNVNINGPVEDRTYIPEEGETSPAYWVVNYRKRLQRILSANFATDFPERALINAKKYITSNVAFYISSISSFLIDMAAILYGTETAEYSFIRKYAISILESVSYVDEDISYDIYASWLYSNNDYDTSNLDINNVFEPRNFNLVYYYLLQKESYKADGYVESGYAESEYFVDGLTQEQTFAEFFEGEQEAIRWINDYSSYDGNAGDYFCVVLGR